MSASSIPNLLALRGGPRSRGSRGRGRGNGPPGSEHGTTFKQRNDIAIQSTDADAAVSRMSAVSLGYLEDPFVSSFVSGTNTRRMPIINRGTYTRTSSLDILINAFIAPNSTDKQCTKQIISLGAGTDTRYFRLRAQNKHRNLIYHEIDFPSVSATKWRTVYNSPKLAQCHQDEAIFTTQVDTPESSPDQDPEWGFTRAHNGTAETVFCFHPIDLRQLPYNSSRPIQSYRGIRTDVTTLIISECCLCYLDVDTAQEVVNWFSQRIPSLGIVLYEPIGVDDSFGQMMVSNLAARNITMPTVRVYKNLSDQKSRLEALGFTINSDEAGNEGDTIEKIWNEWIPATEKLRVDRLEGLDEVEEWQILARHYAVVWGWKGIMGWEGWNDLRQPKQ